MATRAERILDQATVYSENFGARRAAEEEFQRVARERTMQADLAKQVQREDERARKIKDLWRGSGIIELFMDLARLKQWEISFRLEDEVSLGYTSETSVGGMEQGDCGRYSESVFHGIVRARRVARDRWFRPPEIKWFINDKQVGVDGPLDELVSEAIASWLEKNKDVEDYSRFGPGDWDCWKP